MNHSPSEWFSGYKNRHADNSVPEMLEIGFGFFYSPKSAVERYRSPESGSSTTMFLP